RCAKPASTESATRILADANAGDRRSPRRARLSVDNLGRAFDGAAPTRAVQCSDRSDLERARIADPVDRTAPTDASLRILRAAARDRSRSAPAQSPLPPRRADGAADRAAVPRRGVALSTRPRIVASLAWRSPSHRARLVGVGVDTLVLSDVRSGAALQRPRLRRSRRDAVVWVGAR